MPKSEEERHEPCEFCGKPSARFLFARFLCGSDECLDKAQNERGGPAGHMKGKGAGSGCGCECDCCNSK